MMTPTRFAYRAARTDGAIEAGELAADSRDAAVLALANRGLWPVDVRLRRARVAGRPGITTADLALGLRVLATLLDSGLPIREIACRDARSRATAVDGARCPSSSKACARERRWRRCSSAQSWLCHRWSPASFARAKQAADSRRPFGARRP